VQVNAYPDKALNAAVTTIYPTLNEQTRSVAVRLELPNPGGLLKPGMFAQVELPVGAHSKVLTIPLSAVIDSGTRQTVLVQLDSMQAAAVAGRFAPREVRLGARSANFVEVLQGLKDGEQVVTSANFLIDAESNLKAAFAGFAGAAGTGNSGGK
jgi:Cu(I)/Ag(I) efflux system membrane fusion protein